MNRSHGLKQALAETAAQLRREIKVYSLAIRDRRTPAAGKLLLGCAVGYALLPFDLIPDFIPVIGHLDDAVIIPLLVYIALKCIPRELMDELRRQVDAQDRA